MDRNGTKLVLALDSAWLDEKSSRRCSTISKADLHEATHGEDEG